MEIYIYSCHPKLASFNISINAAVFLKHIELDLGQEGRTRIYFVIFISMI